MYGFSQGKCWSLTIWEKISPPNYLLPTDESIAVYVLTPNARICVQYRQDAKLEQKYFSVQARTSKENIVDVANDSFVKIPDTRYVVFTTRANDRGYFSNGTVRLIDLDNESEAEILFDFGNATAIASKDEKSFLDQENYGQYATPRIKLAKDNKTLIITANAQVIYYNVIDAEITDIQPLKPVKDDENKIHLCNWNDGLKASTDWDLKHKYLREIYCYDISAPKPKSV